MQRKTPSPQSKILLVDDKTENLLSLESILQDDNCICTAAKSGDDALRILLKETDFTLIIMDVVMPGMDGFQTARYIAERDRVRDIPIIFLTANDQDSNISTAYKMGAVDYISKPVIPELLKAKVRVFVELQRKKMILEQRTEELKETNIQLEREIHDRKASEAKIERLNKELQLKLNELESLDSFTYSVSHDLKNPITSLSLLMEILLQDSGDVLDEKGIDVIKRSQKQIKRLDQIIGDLLLFSRHGRELDKKEVDMNDVVHSVMEDIRLLYAINGRHQIRIGALPTARCDGGLIRQVWSNLISNAVKYSNDKPKPEIEINASKVDNDVIFSVRDNGIGFNTKEASNLFKVFSRLPSGKKFEGNGVGLAIVKQIVVKHGGRIWAESEPHAGTSFYFTLEG